MAETGQRHVGLRADPDEFAAIRSVGFEPVGQVLGAAVYNVGYTGGYNCPGAWGSYGYGVPARTVTQVSGRGGFGSFAPLVKTMYEARHKAIDRMTDRVRRARRARGGRRHAEHRVVPGRRPGVQGHRHRHPRARRAPLANWHKDSSGRRRTPFTSDLSGQDFAKLIMKGGCPPAWPSASRSAPGTMTG